MREVRTKWQRELRQYYPFEAVSRYSAAKAVAAAAKIIGPRSGPTSRRPASGRLSDSCLAQRHEVLLESLTMIWNALAIKQICR